MEWEKLPTEQEQKRIDSTWYNCKLTAHLIKNKKDHATQRGLKKLLGQRSRLQNYLKKRDFNEYSKVMSGLGLRMK